MFPPGVKLHGLVAWLFNAIRQCSDFLAQHIVALVDTNTLSRIRKDNLPS